MQTFIRNFQARSILWSLKEVNLIHEPADVLICSANVSLNLSGGVGADLLGRYGAKMQNELRRVIAVRTPRATRQSEVSRIGIHWFLRKKENSPLTNAS